jgi:hypothetical protein
LGNPNPSRVRGDLLRLFNLIWVVQSSLQKYFAFGVGQIKFTTRAVLSHRGALRNVTNAGRDAVDADALSDEGR